MNRLERKHRLSNRCEFDHVFSQQNRISTPDFVLMYAANDCGYGRLGMALSKKNVGKACMRNRLKRLIRETFRTHKLPAVDIVVLARSGIRVDRITVATMHAIWDRLITKCAQ